MLSFFSRAFQEGESAFEDTATAPLFLGFRRRAPVVLVPSWRGANGGGRCEDGRLKALSSAAVTAVLGRFDRENRL